uniref:Flagellar hook-length control protein FliK n=1 Tax=Rheinheimera sp. BAL341 TaxID=1708203 RepID=A0A486XVS7_9GAMM
MTQGIQLSMLNLTADSSVRPDSAEPDMAASDQIQFDDVMGGLTQVAKSGQGKDNSRQIPAAVSSLSGISLAMQAASTDSDKHAPADDDSAVDSPELDAGTALAASILAQIALKDKAKPTAEAESADEKTDVAALLADNGNPEAEWELSLTATDNNDAADKPDAADTDVEKNTASKRQPGITPLPAGADTAGTAAKLASSLLSAAQQPQSASQMVDEKVQAASASILTTAATKVSAQADGQDATNISPALQAQLKVQSGKVDALAAPSVLADIVSVKQGEADAEAGELAAKLEANPAGAVAQGQNGKDLSPMSAERRQSAAEKAAGINVRHDVNSSTANSADNAAAAETVLSANPGQAGLLSDKAANGVSGSAPGTSQQNVSERGASQQQASQQGSSQQGSSQHNSGQPGGSQQVMAQQLNHEQTMQQLVSADSNQPAAGKGVTEPSAVPRPESMFGQSLHTSMQRQKTAQLEKAHVKTSSEQLQQSLNLLQQDAATNLRERVSLMVRQNIQVAEIRLDPAGLGQMQIKIDMQQEQASVQFIVQQPQAKELLEQQLPRLRELLQQQGIQLTEGQVQQQSQQQERQMAQRNNHSGAQASGSAVDGGDDNPTGAVAVKVVHSERLVDYYA